jgi:AhpD family alkylhydroperoxidase
MELNNEQEKAFLRFTSTVKKKGALSEKFKELIAVSLAVKSQCLDCIEHHLKQLIILKANDDEINEAIWVAVMMGGGPSMAYALKTQKLLKDLRKK